MKLLVTTDGSARSLVALPHAASLARATGSTITLVRVLDQFMDLGKHLAVKLDDAAALGPILLQLKDNVLEGVHAFRRLPAVAR